jgi:glutamate 5-kinase
MSLQAVERLVVKVGSSVLTDRRGRLLPERIEQLSRQISSCAAGRGILLVSSGAIACGMARLGLSSRPKTLPQLQACAAIGQGELMHLYTRAFAQHKVLTAQVLLTQEDLAERVRFRNAKQTLQTLLRRRVVPIVNENDTVAVEEITFGDNDRLAALVASAVDAQLLVLLTDVDGFLQNGQRVPRVESLRQLDASEIRESRSRLTKGGMASKLEAVRIAGHGGIPVVIANGTAPNVLEDMLAGRQVGTLFVPPANRLNARKWWIAFALRRPHGAVVIDPGAAAALGDGGKSLLHSGIQEVRGRFEAGSFVTVLAADGAELARGVSNFSSSELSRVRGLSSAAAAKLLGHAGAREAIHRDHMVLARELHS